MELLEIKLYHWLFHHTPIDTEKLAFLDDDSNVPIGVLQVKLTLTLISSALVRLMVQVRLRAVPATKGTAGLTGWTTTVGGGETGGRENN